MNLIERFLPRRHFIVNISLRKQYRNSYRIEEHPPSGGFTLLEVLLTTAILVIGLTVVFQTTQSVMKRMAAAKELTEAQQACQTVLNELLAQSAPIKSEKGREVNHLPLWKIDVQIVPIISSSPTIPSSPTISRIYALYLSAIQYTSENRMVGIKYRMVRWVSAERVHVPEPTKILIDNEFAPLFPE